MRFGKHYELIHSLYASQADQRHRNKHTEKLPSGAYFCDFLAVGFIKNQYISVLSAFQISEIKQGIPKRNQFDIWWPLRGTIGTTARLIDSASVYMKQSRFFRQANVSNNRAILKCFKKYLTLYKPLEY